MICMPIFSQNCHQIQFPEAIFSKFHKGACPQTPLEGLCFAFCRVCFIPAGTVCVRSTSAMTDQVPFWSDNCQPDINLLFSSLVRDDIKML